MSPRVAAQTQDNSFDLPKPVPVFSSGMGFITPFEGGQPHLDPLISPVFLVPLGDRWLIESRDTFESDLATLPGSSSFHGTVEKEVDYLQLDYIANPYLTVTVGRFLTPFGIYNERLYPIWIRDLQSDPLILPLGTGPSGAMMLCILALPPALAARRQSPKRVIDIVADHELLTPDHHPVPGWDLLLKPGLQEFDLTAPEKPGEYLVVCTVICSSGHEHMTMKVIVEPKAK